MRHAISAALFIALLLVSTHSMAEGPFARPAGAPVPDTIVPGTLMAEASTDQPGTAGEEADLDEFEDEFDDEFEDEFDDEFGVGVIYDPIEGFNRVVFRFNDKVYFWFLKPAARGYSAVVPEKGRVGVKRFFSNITSPVRIINSCLQLKFKRGSTELARFLINTTVGVLGFTDPANDRWGIRKYREDFGQTLGHHGAGPGFFINLPFLGPSSVRDAVGLVADLFLDPLSYLPPEETLAKIGVYAYRTVNSTSLNITLYEDLKKDALDPYTFIRDAYHQYRENLVRE